MNKKPSGSGSSSKDQPRIKILHQFHNNMFDAVKALETFADVEFLSYRVSKLLPGIKNTKPKTISSPPVLYNPFHLWQLLADADCLVLKHPDHPINIIPYIVARLRGIAVVFIAQRATHFSFFPFANTIAVTKEARGTYLPTPVNVSRFSQTNFHPPGGNQVNILCVSKYQRRKNLDLPVKAIANQKGKHPNIHLTIIGNRTSEAASQNEFERIETLVKELNLQNHVTLKKAIAYEDMPAEYAKADLFILPASSEPLGYALVEAMAAGLPVVVGDDVGARSYVNPGVNGYIFQDKSQTDLESAVEKCLPKLEEFGRASRRLAATVHSPDHWITYFKNLLH